MAVIDFTNIHADRELPDGYYNMVITNAEESETRNGALMIVLELRVFEPEVLQGRKIYEYLSIGKRPFDPGNRSDDAWVRYAECDDPECLDPINHQMNPAIQQFKRILDACKVDTNGSVDTADLVQTLNAGGHELGARIIREEQTEGRFAGRSLNRITFVYPRGQQEPRLDEVKPSRGRASRPKQSAERPSGDSSMMAQARTVQARTRVAVEDDIE